MDYIFLFIIGACVGSFLGALTWRWPREVAIYDGRSKCFKCANTINWYDNIPIISFFILGGKCRNCKKDIPRRDFFVESSGALLFPLAFLAIDRIESNILWLRMMPDMLSVVVVFVILSLSIGIFVIDWEHQYIPDVLVFLMLGICTFGLVLFFQNQFLINISSGLGAALFLLIVHLATLGRGMGLGDVKLAVASGAFLGYPLSVLWMFMAFSLGAVVGIILIILKLAKLKQKIAFGPFLIIAFILSAIFGNEILNLIYFI